MAATFGTFERLDAPLSQRAREHELWLDGKHVDMREHMMDLAGVPEEDRILLRGLRRRGNSGQDEAYAQWDHLLQYNEEEFQEWLGEDGRACGPGSNSARRERRRNAAGSHSTAKPIRSSATSSPAGW